VKALDCQADVPSVGVLVGFLKRIVGIGGGMINRVSFYLRIGCGNDTEPAFSITLANCRHAVKRITMRSLYSRACKLVASTNTKCSPNQYETYS
jgi:hypothetical protein